MKTNNIIRLITACFICLLTLGFCAGNSYAAFAVKAAEHKEATAAPAASEPEHRTVALPRAKNMVGRIKSSFHRHEQSHGGNGVMGIISFAAGLSGIGLIVMGIAGGSTVFVTAIIAAGILGLGATILGAIAARRHEPLRGFAIAGMVLGIIDLSVVMVISVIAAIFASFV